MLPLCIPGIGIKGVVYTARNHEGITTNDLVDRFPTGSLDCVSIERGVYTTAQYTNVPYEPKQQTMLPPPPPPPPPSPPPLLPLLMVLLLLLTLLQLLLTQYFPADKNHLFRARL